MRGQRDRQREREREREREKDRETGRERRTEREGQRDGQREREDTAIQHSTLHCSLDSFNVELSPERYWWGPVGKRGTAELSSARRKRGIAEHSQRKRAQLRSPQPGKKRHC